MILIWLTDVPQSLTETAAHEECCAYDTHAPSMETRDVEDA
jgi:hypothetical protein